MVTAEYHRQWRLKNPGKAQAYNQRWREKHPEKAREATAQWRARNPQYHRAVHLKRTYGLEMADYDAMLTAQKGVCFICQCPEQKRHKLFVDHDHVTGKIRKLLCNKCNSLLGMVNESPERLRKAAQYLEDHSGS